MTKFCERLQALKTQREVSQVAIAEGIGVSAQVMSNYFNGREPDFDVLCRIADFFGVSTDYLLGRTEHQNPKEAAELASSGGQAEPCQGSLSLYRESEQCAELARQLYNEKLHATEEPLLLLEFWSYTNANAKTLREILRLLFSYRDSVDRDQAIETAITGLSSTAYCSKVVAEILRIERKL